jgi:hypothetical protein
MEGVNTGVAISSGRTRASSLTASSSSTSQRGSMARLSSKVIAISTTTTTVGRRDQVRSSPTAAISPPFTIRKLAWEDTNETMVDIVPGNAVAGEIGKAERRRNRGASGAKGNHGKHLEHAAHSASDLLQIQPSNVGLRRKRGVSMGAAESSAGATLGKLDVTSPQPQTSITRKRSRTVGQILDIPEDLLYPPVPMAGMGNSPLTPVTITIRPPQSSGAFRSAPTPLSALTPLTDYPMSAPLALPLPLVTPASQPATPNPLEQGMTSSERRRQRFIRRQSNPFTFDPSKAADIPEWKPFPFHLQAPLASPNASTSPLRTSPRRPSPADVISILPASSMYPYNADTLVEPLPAGTMPSVYPSTTWSETEREAFVEALAACNKRDFLAISRRMGGSKSRAECVEYYYLQKWSMPWVVKRYDGRGKSRPNAPVLWGRPEAPAVNLKRKRSESPLPTRKRANSSPIPSVGRVPSPVGRMEVPRLVLSFQPESPSLAFSALTPTPLPNASAHAHEDKRPRLDSGLGSGTLSPERGRHGSPARSPLPRPTSQMPAP